MNEENTKLKELVTQAREGDAAAFEILYKSHQAGIYTFILSQIRNAEVAADLTQETFVRAWESLRRLRDAGAFRGWLHRIAANLVRDEVKSGRARLEMTESILTDEEGRSMLTETAGPNLAEEEVITRDLQSEVWKALGELTAEQRAAVVMHHLEGMEVKEIAIAMGVRPGTVMSRLSRARETLRQRLARYVEESDERV